jgi:hypothetical protein
VVDLAIFILNRRVEPDGSIPGSSKAQSSPKKPTLATPSEPEQDAAVRAEKLKEQGNDSFRAKNFQEAIDLYTKAIGVSVSYFHASHSRIPCYTCSSIRITARASVLNQSCSILHSH